MALERNDKGIIKFLTEEDSPDRIFSTSIKYITNWTPHTPFTRYVCAEGPQTAVFNKINNFKLLELFQERMILRPDILQPSL